MAEDTMDKVDDSMAKDATDAMEQDITDKTDDSMAKDATDAMAEDTTDKMDDSMAKDATASVGGGDVQTNIQGFTLQELIVQVGDTVSWTQQDGVAHTTTSGTPGNLDGAWDSGPIPQGQRRGHHLQGA